MSRVAQMPLATRTIFFLLAFRGSSASCPFLLHDPLSVAGSDESAMNSQ
jgi:hypothetical protein